MNIPEKANSLLSKIEEVLASKTELKEAINEFESDNPALDSDTPFSTYPETIDNHNTFTAEALDNFEAKLADITGEAHSGETPKDIIVNALTKVGQTVTTSNSWEECAEAIKDTRDYLDPSWVHIDEILEADTGIDGLEYATNLIFIEASIDPSTTITMDTTCVGVKTSDGYEYTYANDGSSITHVWDQEQEFTDSVGSKYRWVIQYYNDASSLRVSPYMTQNLEWVCFGHNFVLNTGSFRWYYTLRAITSLDERLVMAESAYSAFAKCYCLAYLCPLDCTNVTSIQAWFGDSDVVFEIDILLTSSQPLYYSRNIGYFVCKLTINNGGEYIYPSDGSLYFRYAGPTYIYGYLDATACTSVDFTYNTTMVQLKCKLPDLTMDLSSMIKLDLPSLTYICDNISATTTNTITLGTILQTRAGQDNLDKLIAKGWTIA